ncbi:unnamed protein product [Anisakis simplex]|uniref:Rabphilin-1 (inferred by orthology to a C. elegans protein) n=1 Tax=Anisakis simplex TaxID=6269 RepID=A0A0M3JX98_ANISI|nr:unnamed protein product [Anisakis simplex]
MNDWEIGGTQNKWVCPSDRHLQLRAQLKSGWSVRTATARSPTNSKQQNGGITEAEQEHIKAVLARAEAGRLTEQQRIGKMVDRLEKMRNRATGNGVTQCLLCSTDFGLLASKSYAAMCSDCRKYVCQKNCGVETYDSVRHQNIFLCKICSEYREVVRSMDNLKMWKKSGAWFYKELPDYIRPVDNGEVRSPPFNSKTWQHHSKASSSSNGATSSHRHRQLPSTPDQNKFYCSRTKSPRPRITPSWVKEKVQSSMSIGTDDENVSTSEGEGFSSKDELQKSAMPVPRRSRPQKHNSLGKSSLQRYVIGGRSHITDTEESGDSRHTSPSTSPRHSPSSYGDDLSQNPSSIIASDAKSIDSGVVPSDHSAFTNAQLSISHHSSMILASSTTNTSSSPTQPVLPQPASINEPELACSISPLHTPSRSPSLVLPPQLCSPISLAESQFIRNIPNRSSSDMLSTSTPPSFPTEPPPIPPRNNSKVSSLPDRCLSITSSTSSIHRNPLKTTSNRESFQDTSENIKQDEPTTSFMSSPEDELSTLGSIQFDLLYLPDENQLNIKLIQARNLKAMDKNGFSDPYVKFYLIPGAAKATKLASKTIEKSLNPEWNEDFTYYGVTEDDRLKKTLRITVLDRDRIGSDFLGETRVALKKLTPGQPKKFNMYLEHAMPVEKRFDSDERGKILVGLVYSVQQGSLFVSIKRCVELVGMDSTGFSDPYVKVALIPLTSKTHRQKTSTKKRTLNPEFNETLSFVVPFKDLPKKTLQIGVYDRDVGKQDDYIGGILLSASAKGDRQKQWINCVQNPGSSSEYWHKLELES